LARPAHGEYGRVIGGELGSHDLLGSHAVGRQAIEISIVVAILNQMLPLGRPQSVRVG
jgi:hypothetical protein